TYAELVEEVESIAAGLAARGVKTGTRFATALPNLYDHCLVALALHRLGAVVALLNFRLKAEDIAALVERTRIEGAVILPDPDLAARLRTVLPAGAPLFAAGGAAGAAEDLAACRGARASAPPYPSLDPEAPSMLFYTSGTTGLPKGVLLAHRTHEPRVTWLPTQVGFRGGTHLRSLAIAPLSHAIGYHGIFLSTLAFSGTFYALSPLEPSRALDVIERNAINYLFTLPTILQGLVGAPSYSPERMRSLETVYWGGAPIDPALYDRLRREWPAKLGHIYGTTETMCALCNPEPADQPDVLRQVYGSRVRIADLTDFDRTVAAGADGELLIDATTDAIFSGYLDRPDATAEKLRAGWYLTGDGAVELPDGSVRLLGRVDDMIRSGGEYIQPEEVETVLRSHPAVRDVAVVGITDPKWGQIAIACVAGDAGAAPALDLDRLCRESRVANFKRPRGYVYLEALPWSPAGKLLRRELRAIATRARGGDGAIRFEDLSSGVAAAPNRS
ncbi:MAG TPA: AMP-binding protein, partial [Thermoanaerobaculia bacterium]|nr:AMP-binding protein [Thermoanaerobaculia bacterium]